jgi:hypothetical protein
MRSSVSILGASLPSSMRATVDADAAERALRQPALRQAYLASLAATVTSGIK